MGARGHAPRVLAVINNDVALLARVGVGIGGRLEMVDRLIKGLVVPVAPAKHLPPDGRMSVWQGGNESVEGWARWRGGRGGGVGAADLPVEGICGIDKSEDHLCVLSTDAISRRRGLSEAWQRSARLRSHVVRGSV